MLPSAQPLLSDVRPVRWQAGGSQFYKYAGEALMNGLVSVTFELRDTKPNGGGMCCIPGLPPTPLHPSPLELTLGGAGTHKSNVALPEEWVDLREGEGPPNMRRIDADAGDVVSAPTPLRSLAPFALRSTSRASGSCR